MKKNYYQILNIDENASENEVKEAYHLMMKMLHPDRFDKTKQRDEWIKANELVQEINEAYTILKDPYKRKKYNESLNIGDRSQGSPQEHPTKEEPTRNVKDIKVEKTKNVLNGTVCFNDLPTKNREKVVKLFTEKTGEKIVVWERALAHYIVFLVLGSIVPIISVFATNNLRWEESTVAWANFGNLISFITIGIAFAYIDRWRRSFIKPKIIFTPMYLIKSSFDKLYFRWLWNMDNIQSTEYFKNKIYEETRINIKYGNKWEKIVVKSQSTALTLLDKLSKWELRIKNDIAAKQYNKLTEEDFFNGITKEHCKNNYWFLQIRYIILLLMPIIFFFFYSNLLKNLNTYFDDKISWGMATTNNTASAYRLYIVTHENGKWVDDAKHNIDLLYNNAIQNYGASLSQGYENQAVQAIIALIEQAKNNGDYRVPVLFQGVNKMPYNLEAKWASFGYNNIIPINDAFSAEKMTARQDRILDEMKGALKTVIPGDILDFSITTDPGRAKIVIRYEILASRNLYYRESQKAIDKFNRPYYPGVILNWNCSILANYSFKLESEPAEHFTYSGRGVYEDMTDSAFRDFKFALVSRIGLSK